MIAPRVRWMSALCIAFFTIVFFRPDIMNIDTIARRRQISSRVTYLVTRIKSNDRKDEALSELVTIAKGRFEFGAMKAIVGIGELGVEATPILDVLGSQLFRGGYIAQEAAFSLAELGSIAKSQLPQLEKAIDDQSFNSRHNAYEAIGNMGVDAIYLLPKLKNHWDSKRTPISEDPLREAIKKLEQFKESSLIVRESNDSSGSMGDADSK